MQSRILSPKGIRERVCTPPFKKNVHVLFIYIIYIHIHEELLQAPQSTDFGYFPVTRQQLHTFFRLVIKELL